MNTDRIGSCGPRLSDQLAIQRQASSFLREHLIPLSTDGRLSRRVLEVEYNNYSSKYTLPCDRSTFTLNDLRGVLLRDLIREQDRENTLGERPTKSMRIAVILDLVDQVINPIEIDF